MATGGAAAGSATMDVTSGMAPADIRVPTNPTRAHSEPSKHSRSELPASPNTVQFKRMHEIKLEEAKKEFRSVAAGGDANSTIEIILQKFLQTMDAVKDAKEVVGDLATGLE